MNNLELALHIRTFTHRTEFENYFIDEVINIAKAHVDFYIYHDDYGIKLHLFGTDINERNEIKLTNLIIMKYIERYKDMFED